MIVRHPAAAPVYPMVFKGGAETSTSQATPVVDPKIKKMTHQALDTSQDISQQPRSFFGGQTYADLDPYQRQALEGVAQRGLAGSPLNAAAQNQAMATIQGQNFDNPHLQGAIDASTRPIYEQLEQRTLPGITSGMAQAGRFGMEGNQGNQLRLQATEDANRLASDQAAKLAFGAYGQERGLQQQAMFGAPGLAETDFGDLSRTAGAGGMLQAQDQRGINEAMQRHQFGQDEEYNRLARHLGMIQGGAANFPAGQLMTNQSGSGSNPLMGAIGGAAALAPLGPWGAAAGGAAGLMGGMF